MKKNKKILIGLLILILTTLVLLLIDRNTYKEYTKNYFYMDTYINIKINSTKNKKEINAIFDDIDYIYSTYHKLTDRHNQYDKVINIYYLNEILDNNKEIEIDKRLSDIIKLGIKYHNETDGLFNIASGNLTNTWKKFIDNCDKLPSKKELNVNTNINDIKLEDNIYTKQNNIKLDLGGIAKGYATEIVGNYLEERKIESYIINAGGNVKVGKAHDKENYVVGITNPDDTSTIFNKVNINNLSVVTTGNYQRYCKKNNKIYSHVINPITKYPSNYAKSVTIIGKDSGLCDIYSTYLYLMPIEEGKKIVNNTPGIEAIWYIDNNNIIKSEGYNYE